MNHLLQPIRTLPLDLTDDSTNEGTRDSGIYNFQVTLQNKKTSSVSFVSGAAVKMFTQCK